MFGDLALGECCFLDLSFQCAESKEWTVADLHTALPALVKNSGVCALISMMSLALTGAGTLGTMAKWKRSQESMPSMSIW